VSRKHDAIDLMAIYAKKDSTQWNQVLTQHFNSMNTAALARLLYGLQAGMDDLTKNKMNDEKMTMFFLRLQKSVENTFKAILRKKYPNPYDSPLFKDKSIDEKRTIWLSMKRKRDNELEVFLRKVSY
jgi:hypothetical protein